MVSRSRALLLSVVVVLSVLLVAVFSSAQFSSDVVAMETDDEIILIGLEEGAESDLDRRELYYVSQRRRRYFISYGALTANRVPCPPRSGRSYYTPNCFTARGPVHPYSRGCSAIARCRR